MLRIVAALLLFALLAPMAAADSEHSNSAEHRQDGQHRQCKDACAEPAGDAEPDAEPAPSSEEEPAAEPPQSGESTSEDEGTLGNIKILGIGGPGNALPIPSCEPWLILSKPPQVRPECLLPSNILK